MLPCFRLSLPISHWLGIVLKLATWNQVPILYKNGSLVSRPTMKLVSPPPHTIDIFYNYARDAKIKVTLITEDTYLTVLYLFRKLSE